MAPAPTLENPDAGLARALSALATPTRLAVLRQLWAPRLLRDIHVRAGAGDEGGGAPRPISRQAVREHLDRLMEVGLVANREVDSEYGMTVAYSLNHQTVFAISEELRSLAAIRPLEEPGGATVHKATPAMEVDHQGPHLVLVKGLDEGRAFPLKPPRQGRREWVVGRRRGLDVSLDFDPFVSTENAVVAWESGAFTIRDLPESRNGTTLNFRPLPRGATRPLRTGDVIGIGRSLVLFRA